MSIFHQTYKVYINHTDAGGIVYHANHLTFFENCRRDWLNSLGFNGYFFDKEGVSIHDEHGQAHSKIHFVVSDAKLSYKLPLLLDETLVVSIHDIIKKNASMIITQHIYKNNEDFAVQKIATTGIITIACVIHSESGIRPHPLPKAFR